MAKLTKQEKDKLVELFYSVPKKQQTQEMCEVAVERDWKAIKQVSKRFLTEDLCIKAIKNDFHAFFLMGKEQMTSELLYHVFKKGNEGSYVVVHKIASKIERFKGLKLEDLIDKKVALEMVKYRGKLIKIIPSHLKTDMEVLNVAVQTYGQAIEFIAKEQQTKELVLNAIEGGVHVLNINEDLLDDEVVKTILSRWALCFNHLPDKKKTYENCLFAVKGGLLLRDIPPKYYTQEMFDTLVHVNCSQIINIPNEFIHEQMLLNVVKTNPNYITSANLEPNRLTRELVEKLVRKGVSLKAKWLRKFQTEELVAIALENNARDIQYVQPKFMTKELVEKFVAKDPYILSLVNKKYIDEEICYLAVSKGLGLCHKTIQQYQSQRIVDKAFENNKNSYRHMKSEFKTKEVSLEAFEANHSLIAYIPEEYQTEEMWKRTFEIEYRADRLLEYLPKKFWTDDVLSSLVRSDWRSIHSIPKEYRTSNLLMLAYEQDKRALEHLGV